MKNEWVGFFFLFWQTFVFAGLNASSKKRAVGSW